MAFAAFSHQPRRISAQPRTVSVCRVHSCARCHVSIDSAEPCSFVPAETNVCRLCRGQEQALLHLAPLSRTPWAAGLLSARTA
jgi:hypothetical protein